VAQTSITVKTPVGNTAPVAHADTITTESNTAVTIDVLSNDSDVDGDALSISKVSQPAHGAVTVSGGNLVYSPATDYSGQDSFSYTVSDGKGGEASTAVTVTVQAQQTTTTWFFGSTRRWWGR